MSPLPRLSLDFSQSSLQDYADCPRRFQLRYLDKTQWPAIETEPSQEVEARQREGLEFHRLVHQHLVGISAEELAKSAGSGQVRAWWENYRAADLNLQGWALKSELVLHSTIGEHRLVAKYDLIALQDGRASIYDWKTWARRPSNAWLERRWQTRVYRALLVKGGAVLNGGRPFLPEAVSMTYWFAAFPDEPAAFSYDSVRLDEDWTAIETLIAEVIDRQSFPLTEDRRRCRFCIYRSYCDRGERAGEWQDPGDEASAEPYRDAGFDESAEPNL
jgi:predicted RecB family nuclease